METQTTTLKPKTSPKDFFLHVGAIVLLYFLVINTIVLLFEIIDGMFPRTLGEGLAYGTPDISFPLAALIVGFPLLLVLFRTLSSAEKEDPIKRELSLRKWLTFLTLFITGTAMIVDLITLLSTFLRGDEIMVGFILKILSVLIVAGAVFGYYLADLRYRGMLPVGKYFAYGTAVFVLFVVGSGFAVFGSPATQKAQRFDSERVSNLQTIQYQVLDYWQNKRTVPAKLDDLKDALRGMTPPADPKTGLVYGYEKLSTTSFKLCATFEREGGTRKSAARVGQIPSPVIDIAQPTPAIVGLDLGDYWEHGVGTVCFERAIDPTRYPPTKMQ